MRTFVFLFAIFSLCMPAEADIKFTDVTDASGIDFRHFTGATGNVICPKQWAQVVPFSITMPTVS